RRRHRRRPSAYRCRPSRRSLCCGRRSRGCFLGGAAGCTIGRRSNGIAANPIVLARAGGAVVTCRGSGRAQHRGVEPLIDGNDSFNVQLQPLGLLDLAVAAALHASCFDRAWRETAIGELLPMPGSFGALARIEDQPAGLVIALAVGAEAEILALGVLPKFRRRGIAARLLALVMDRSSGAGCRRLLLEVAEDNEAARALYGKLGFAEIGRRPNYYRRAAGAVAEAIVLARALDRRSD